MWFKTRVGLSGFTGNRPIDIRINHTPPASPGMKRWFIFAHVLYQDEGEAKGIFGQFRWANPSIYLAMFSDGEGVQDAIAECMEMIETSLRSEATVCDLSEVGDNAAWGEKWNKVRWRR